MWFRRDLRLHDHPALNAAIEAAFHDGDGQVVALFNIDSKVFDAAGTPLQAYQNASLASLNESLNGNLLIRYGDPKNVLIEVVKASNAKSVQKFKKAPPWFMPLPSEALPKVNSEIEIPKAGEANALELLDKFLKTAIKGYDENRNRPDLNGTSKLSIPLRFGEIHPRTILIELNDTKDHDTFRKEICWREFYAEVLATAPDSETKSLDQKWELMGWDQEKDFAERLKRWQEGKTGFPIVDAGMRQLKQTGWMHNRVRMIVASFLVKDLHIHWRHGADWFMKHLLDGDIASNSHGWQWTAGCGTDASPYYRIFNPMMQAEKFDPNAEYVHKYIPELKHLAGIKAHTPWDQPDGYINDYPQRMVDHSEEREETLRRYKASKGEKVIKEQFSQ
jgi:deoxyribodipyrimidine photo-lyase